MAARAAIRNIGTAIENLAGQGAITAAAADELRLRAESISKALDARQYDDAAQDAKELDARIDALIANGDLAASAELTQEVDKLRAALPRV